MKKQAVLEILKEVESGRLSADEALVKLKLEPFEDMGFAKVDLHRELRQVNARSGCSVRAADIPFVIFIFFYSVR